MIKIILIVDLQSGNNDVMQCSKYYQTYNRKYVQNSIQYNMLANQCYNIKG